MLGEWGHLPCYKAGFGGLTTLTSKLTHSGEARESRQDRRHLHTPSHSGDHQPCVCRTVLETLDIHITLTSKLTHSGEASKGRRLAKAQR